MLDGRMGLVEFAPVAKFLLLMIYQNAYPDVVSYVVIISYIFHHTSKTQRFLTHDDGTCLYACRLHQIKQNENNHSVAKIIITVYNC